MKTFPTAAGNKLKKVTLENNASVLFNINYTSNITTTTQYVSGFVYESKTYSNSSLSSLQYTDVLQFTGHEEGRIRRKLDGTFAYDYFLKDHLGNHAEGGQVTRMVLTEEKKTDAYPAASMETAQASTEEALYANLPEIRTAKPAGYPTDNYTNPNTNVARVKAAAGSQKMGPSIILKVMGGDTYNLRVSSWYKKNGSTPSNTNSIVSDLVTNMINSLAGPGALLHGNITPTQLTNSGVITTSATSFLNNQPTPGTTKPKAYLNWVLLDEQFKLVTTNSSAEQVGNDLEFKVHVKNNMPVSKSGYLYVYVSNEIANIDVYFDNLQVTHVRGPILEETHYYPFGLTMAGISSKAAGSLENKRKWNKGSELENKEFSDGSGLELYSTFYRSLDPQLGRFWQIDPKPDYSQSLYSSMNNNPISFNDPLGDTSVYNEQGKQVANYGSKDVNYVIKTTQTTSGLGSSDPGTISNPISSKEAQRTERYLQEANLWSEASNVSLTSIKGNIVQIKNTDQIQAAEAAVSKDDGTRGIGSGNNREYHGVFTSKGVKANSPDSVADPIKGLPATSVSNGPIDYHSHPSGSKRMTLPGGGGATASWNQPPSGQDIKTAKGTQYVFAMFEKKIYIYNATGVVATIPMGSIKK